MLTRALLGLALLVALPAWSQVSTSGSPGDVTPEDETRMLTPPPVSGKAYPNLVGSEVRSNFLGIGLVFNSAYDDNVLGNISSKPVSDVIYSIRPAITLDQNTARQHRAFTYNPGFTLYQRTSALNAQDQGADLDFQYRLSPHSTIDAHDSFQKSQNIFNQSDPLSSGGVTGGGQTPAAYVVVPAADQLNNAASAELSFQFSRNGMVGASGTLTNLHYPNPKEVPGLFDSTSREGSAFYSHRLFDNQYLGANYRYEDILAYPVKAQTETQAHNLFAFYTVYFKRTFSVSLSAGPQYYVASEYKSPDSRSWAPAGMASIGWQAMHTNLAASYSHAVTAGGGLLGAFTSNSASVSARWQLARTWIAGAGANYAINKNAVPTLSLSSPGGHSVSGTVSLQHSFGQRIQWELGYARLHQSYGSIAVISSNPDSDRAYVSISYQFTRPLGR